MYQLLKNHLSGRKDHNLLVFTSLCFALLPFVPVYGLSIAGVPLAINAFLNFRNNKNGLKDWLVLFILHIYGSFLLSFLFITFIFFGVLIFDYFKSHKLNKKLFLSLMFFSLLFILFQYRLFYVFLFETIESSRINNNTISTSYLYTLSNFKSFIKNIFMNGTPHTPSYHYLLFF